MTSSWADAIRFGPGDLNGWAVGPESQCVSDQRSICSHSLAQSEATSQVNEKEPPHAVALRLLFFCSTLIRRQMLKSTPSAPPLGTS